MYHNGYSVRVVGGKEIPGGYVEIGHGQRYSLALRNSNVTRCDASVEIDGQHVGTWRIPSHRSITLERGVNDDGHFTAYLLHSQEGDQVGLRDDANLGLIKVAFTPEERPRPVVPEYTSGIPVASAGTYYRTRGGAQSFGMSKGIQESLTMGGSPVGTGLSGHSSQRFQQADEMQLDYSRQTVIHLRLVAPDGDSPRPLSSTSTPVPPRVR